MVDTKIFLKKPINFKNKFFIYPPSVNDVIDEDDFSIFQKIFTVSQEELEDEFLKQDNEIKDVPTPFQYLLINCCYNEEFLKQTKKAFKFFTKQEITPLFQMGYFLIGDLEEVIVKAKKVEDLVKLEESDYFEFQNKIREIVRLPTVEPPNLNEDPRIRQIKAKARYRDKIKAKQGNGIDFTSALASICCMGFGLNPLNIGDIGYATANILVDVYQNKEKYDLDINSLLAGGDSKKIKPQYWIKQL